MTLDEIAEAVSDVCCSTPLVIIVGGPSTGKSSLAHRLVGTEHHRVRCTDELVGVLEWSEASAEVARWFDEPGEWIIEGVATARALRKWLAANPERPLKAVVVLMPIPMVELTKGQVAMGKGVATVWNEIAVELLRRGARVLNAASTKPVRGSSEEATQPAAAE